MIMKGIVMSREFEFFIYLIERYAEAHGVSARDVLRQWDSAGITDTVHDMYDRYHCEAIENAFADIESLMSTAP